MSDLLIQVQDLHNQGFTHRKIGELLDHDTSWVLRRLKKLNISGNNYNFFEPTPDHMPVLVGTMMGDGSLKLNSKMTHARMSLNHGPVQKDYLQWKVDYFGSLFKKSLTQDQHIDGRTGKRYGGWYNTSRQHPWLTEWRHIFYPEGKKVVTEEILSYIDDQALAIWWCDDGGTDSSEKGRYKFHTGNLSSSEYELLYAWFSAQGFDPHIYYRTENSVMYIFRAEGSRELRRRISPYIPESMLYKFNRHLGG